MTASAKSKHAVFTLGLLLLCFGCQKVDPNIFTIRAGDKSSSNINYVNLGSAIAISRANLDIDKDKQNDLSFYYETEHAGAYFYMNNGVNILNTNVYICVDGSGYPLKLHTGDKIDATLNWSNYSPLCLYTYVFSGYPNNMYESSGGNWESGRDGYLGFKIVKNSGTYWGWIRIGASSPEDYAYIKI